MIRREWDAELHNRIANDPAVKPTFGYNQGPTDLSPLLAEPESYILLSNGSDGAVIYEWSAPGVWQAHTMFLPSCRGRRAIDDAKAMIAWMFDHAAAEMLWGQTPMTNRPARMFNRLFGGKPAGLGREANGREVEYFKVER